MGLLARCLGEDHGPLGHFLAACLVFVQPLNL